MVVTLLEQIAVGEAPPFVPITVEQYHSMIRLGILPEGAVLEWIDGLLVGRIVVPADRHPTSADVIAAIEVAHNSLRFDRSTKQRAYAQAGIGQYWIVNREENQIEVCQESLPADGNLSALMSADQENVLPGPRGGRQ
ncbi:MAG TPA: Uma2 family endonuclease [Gemmataceae bacterium]|nr:Uma2 family endonuclease [Gemmataceae bacterium]